jgi:hypothetical protein
MSGQYWEAQERWKVKRDIYLRLLNSLRELAAVVDAEFDLDQQRMLNYRHDDENDAVGDLPAWWDDFEKKRRAQLEARWAPAWKLFNEGRGSFPLVLSDTTVEALKHLDRDMNKAEHEAETSDALWGAYNEVLASAKGDLELSL